MTKIKNIFDKSHEASHVAAELVAKTMKPHTHTHIYIYVI
jgi:hypothetical protein